ncbi:MAG: S1C family serine protease [candidate division Zixibacteria bacterium]|nr:S1C family serine protease [candidate division Zixibacteria bacterium]
MYALFLAVFFSYSPSQAQSPLNNLESGLSDLVVRLSQSIVTVEAAQTFEAGNLSATTSKAFQRLIASGIVCDTSGHIIVAASSVHGYDRFTIIFENRKVAAKLVGVDFCNRIAVLKPERAIGQPVKIAERQLCAGSMVIALGNAYGLRASPTLGFCAGTRQDGSLQFSLPVTSGSAGGGVFDLSGRLLGVITGGVDQDDRLAVAIPSIQIPKIVSFLIEHGDRQAGHIGLSSADVEISPAFDIKSSLVMAKSGGQPSIRIDRGVVVTGVGNQSPAERAGLRKGDIVIGVNGRPITLAAELYNIVRQSCPGNSLEIDLIRNSHPLTIAVVVGNKSIKPQSAAQSFSANESLAADSLLNILNFLKAEITRLEERLNIVD